MAIVAVNRIFVFVKVFKGHSATCNKYGENMRFLLEFVVRTLTRVYQTLSGMVLKTVKFH